MNKNFGPLPPEPASLAEQSPSPEPLMVCCSQFNLVGVHSLPCEKGLGLMGAQERRTGGGLGATAVQTCPSQSHLPDLLTPEFLQKQTKSGIRRAMRLLESELKWRGGEGWRADSAEAAVAQGFDWKHADGTTTRIGGFGATEAPIPPNPPGVLFITPSHVAELKGTLTPEAAQSLLLQPKKAQE